MKHYIKGVFRRVTFIFQGYILVCFYIYFLKDVPAIGHTLVCIQPVKTRAFIVF